MKLYAVRDVLIDYYLKPFTAQGDKEVLSSLMETINDVENKAPIAQTPGHFELWSLAEVDPETGLVIPKKELVASCSALVRRDVRESVDSRREAIRRASSGERDQAGKSAGNEGARPGAAQGASQAENCEGEEIRGAAARGTDPYNRGGRETA